MKLNWLATLLFFSCGLCAEDAKSERLNLSDAEIDTYITQLNDEQFAVRERAYKCLLACGSPVLPAIRKALNETTDTEVKSQLAKLERLCDTGGEPLSGVSVKLIVDKTEIKSGESLKFTLRFLNKNTEPQILVVNSSSQRRFTILENESAVEIQTPPPQAPVVNPVRRARSVGNVELPAHETFDLETTLVILSALPTQPDPTLETPYVVLPPGEHTLKLRVIGSGNNTEATNAPRRLYHPNGTFFMSTAGIWGESPYSNEIKITVKEK